MIRHHGAQVFTSHRFRRASGGIYIPSGGGGSAFSLIHDFSDDGLADGTDYGGRTTDDAQTFIASNVGELQHETTAPGGMRQPNNNYARKLLVDAGVTVYDKSWTGTYKFDPLSNTNAGRYQGVGWAANNSSFEYVFAGVELGSGARPCVQVDTATTGARTNTAGTLAAGSATYTVAWDADTKTITSTLGGNTATLTLTAGEQADAGLIAWTHIGAILFRGTFSNVVIEALEITAS